MRRREFKPRELMEGAHESCTLQIIAECGHDYLMLQAVAFASDNLVVAEDQPVWRT